MASENNTQIFYSKEALVKFPVLACAKDLFSSDAPKVYVFSLSDIEADMPAEKIKIMREITRGERDEWEGQKAANKIAYEEPAALRKFIGEKYPELLKILDDEILKAMEFQLVSGQAHAWGVPLDDTAEAEYINFLLTPYHDATKEEVARFVSALPLDSFENLPGTAEDWRTLFIIHEMGHLENNIIDVGVAGEVFADLHLQKTLNREFNCKVTSEDISDKSLFFDAYQGLRAIASFAGTNDHFTNAFIRSGDEGFAPQGSVSKFSDAFHRARKAVYIKIGKGIPDDATHSLHGKPTRDVVVGEYAAKENPEELYKTVREFYNNGEFNNNPIGKLYAYEYLRAAQKYAPTVHGADPKEEFDDPPRFDESGVHVPVIEVMKP